jgi:hypothetical protein
VIVPLIVSLTVWLLTGSTFALVGAILGPTMVVAHFVDARRRTRRDTREKSVARTREDSARRETELVLRAAEIRSSQRARPSVTEIAGYAGWSAPRDGDTHIRAGSCADGQPWLVDVSDGVAVVGDGIAADAVWETLCFHGTAHLGAPESEDERLFWPGGAYMVRGPSTRVATTIHCAGNHVVSVGRRGSLPERVEYQPDFTSPSAASVARSRLSGDVIENLELTLSSATPHALFAGRTGSGKSHALVVAVSDWANRFSPAEFTFIGIDFKGGATLRQVERLPHHRGTVTDLDGADVTRVLHAITTEMCRREETLRDLAQSSIDDAREIPRLAIVIDEVHEFFRRFPAAHDVIGDVARRGRSLGVHLVLAVQHPTGVVRDSALGNIPIRVCLAMNTPYDVMAVLGQPTTLTPSPGTALVTTGDGRIREVRIPQLVGDGANNNFNTPLRETLWRPAVTWPLTREGREGFGILDDIPRAQHAPAAWSPNDGDVLVIGDAGSGRTWALHALAAGHAVTWIGEPQHLVGAAGIVVIDNLDRLLDALSPVEALNLLAAIARARRQSVRFLVSSTSLIRGLDPFRDTLTLRRATLDEHRATGAPIDTFDPAARPGVGTWRGLRVVVYARTDSIDTASIP